MGKIQEIFDERIEFPEGGHADAVHDPRVPGTQDEQEPDGDDQGKPQGMMTKAEREQYAKFKEEDHPRDESGKFGSGGGTAVDDDPPFALKQETDIIEKQPGSDPGEKKKQGTLFEGLGEMPGQRDWIEEQEEREKEKPKMQTAAEKKSPTSSPEFKNWFGDSKVVNDDGSPKVIYHGTTAALDEFSPFGQVVSGSEMGAGTYLTSDPTKAGAYATGEGGNIMPVFLKAENIFDKQGTITDEQREAISRRLSQDILPEDRNYNNSTPQTKRFSGADKEKAFDLFDERMSHWEQFGGNVDRYQPKERRDGDDWIVEYYDPDVVGVSPNGQAAFSQLMNTYGIDYTRVLAEIGIDAVQSGSTYVVTSPTQIKSSSGNQGSFDPDDPRINYAKFDESEHPRDADGKFGEGGGSTATQEKPRATKKKKGKPPTKTEMRKREVKYNRANRLAGKRDYLVDRATRDMRSRTPEKADAAAVMRLILETGMRPGYNRPKEQPSFGASTLQARHIDANGETTLKFVGKSQVEHEIKISDKPLAEFLKRRAAQVRKTGGEDAPLFNVRESQLLKYAKNISGGKTFKVKDYRTMHGTMAARNLVSGMPTPTSKKEYKEAVKRVGDHVASILGNTRSVSLQSYIDHRVFEDWKDAAGY